MYLLGSCEDRVQLKHLAHCPPSPSGRAGGALAGGDAWEAQLTVLSTASPRREGGPHATLVEADVTVLSTAGGTLAADFM